MAYGRLVVQGIAVASVKLLKLLFRPHVRFANMCTGKKSLSASIVLTACCLRIAEILITKLSPFFTSVGRRFYKVARDKSHNIQRNFFHTRNQLNLHVYSYIHIDTILFYVFSLLVYHTRATCFFPSFQGLVFLKAYRAPNKPLALSWSYPPAYTADTSL